MNQSHGELDPCNTYLNEPWHQLSNNSSHNIEDTCFIQCVISKRMVIIVKFILQILQYSQDSSQLNCFTGNINSDFSVKCIHPCWADQGVSICEKIIWCEIPGFYMGICIILHKITTLGKHIRGGWALPKRIGTAPISHGSYT